MTSSNKLKKNYHDWAIFSIINDVKIKEKNVVGWKIVAGKKITTDLTIKIIRKFNGEMVLSPKSSYQRNILESMITANNKLNIFFPTEMVLFQSEVKEYNERGVTIDIPDMIAQLDRRQYLRYKVEEDVQVEIEFKKNKSGVNDILQKFKKQCFDISAGGLSFYVSKTEYSYFRRGDEIEQIDLIMDGKKVKIAAEIINIFDQEPDSRNGLFYKSWKICLQYSKIQEDTRKKINDFVFQNVDFVEDVI